MADNLNTEIDLENQIDAELGLLRQPQQLAAEPVTPELNFEAQIEKQIDTDIQKRLYGTPQQKTLAAFEAGLRGLVSGPVATGIELATGLTTKEDIASRKEQLGEGMNLASEAIGFLLPTILTAGTGAAARAGLASAGLAAKAAQLGKFTQAGLVSKAAELGAKKATSDIARKMIAVGLEGALVATADEATKNILSKEPINTLQSIQSAAINIGGAAAFGAGLGYGMGKIPMWKAKFGKPVQELADNLSGADPDDLLLSSASKGLATEAERKAFKNAILQKKPNASQIKEAAQRQGLPVTEGMLSGNSWVQRVDSSLTKSPTVFGALQRLVYDKGFDKADDVLFKAIKTDLPLETSRAELGEAIVASFEPEIRKTKDLMDNLYSVIRQETQFVPVSEQSIKKFTNKLLSSPRVIDNPRSPIATFAKNLADDLTDRAAMGNYTVDNLRNVISDLPSRVGLNAKERSFMYEVRDLLTNLQDNEILKFAKDMPVPGTEAKAAVRQLVNQIKETNKLYGPFRNDLRTLAEGLGFRITGPADFLVKLSEMKPEAIQKRLFAKENVRLLKFMQEKFPKELKLVMDFEKNELLKRFSKREKLKTLTLIDSIKKLPKEVQEAMFGRDQLQNIDDVKTWINAMPENVNPSNTSQGVAFNEYFSGKGLVMTAADLSKVAVLKMVGAGKRPTATGVKVMTDYLNSSYAGYTAANKAVRAVLFPEKSFPISNPKERELDSLDAQAKEFQSNPSAFLNMSGELADLLPEQAQAQQITAARIYSYLNQKRPKARKMGVLGQELPPTKAQEADYKRTLEIAEQPAIVLKKIYDGNLQSKDIQDLNTMYPELRNQFLVQIMKELVPKISKGEQLPLKIKKGLSLFGAMPLDTTFNPQSIQAAQSVFQKNNVPPQQQLPQMAPKSSRKSQLPSLTETDSQRRMLNR